MTLSRQRGKIALTVNPFLHLTFIALSALKTKTDFPYSRGNPKLKHISFHDEVCFAFSSSELDKSLN